MKNKTKLFLIITIVAIIGLSITACDDGIKDSNGAAPIISGTFIYEEKSVQFIAQKGSTPRSARSVGGAVEFTGKINDGETVFDLSGFYLSSTGSFLLSAGSDSLVYEIAGISANGNLQADARAKTLDADNWKIFADNSVTSANDINITASASSEQLGGLPASWIGRWVVGNNTLDVTPFAILAYGADAILPLDLLEIIELSPTKFDIITQGPGEVLMPCDVHSPYGDMSCDDCYSEDYHFIHMFYSKIRLEQIGSNLKLTAFGTISDLDSETNPTALEDARNLDIDDPPFPPLTRSYSR